MRLSLIHNLPVTIGLLFSFSNLASAHPFHASLTEGEWNSETNCLEIAVKLDPNDLEKAVRRVTGRLIDIEDKSSEKAIRSYVTSSFRVRPSSAKESKPIELKWVGYEVDLKAVWLYFEVPLPAGPEGIEITNTLLHKDVPHQKNYVTIKAGKRKASVICTAEKPTQIVNFTVTDQPDSKVE